MTWKPVISGVCLLLLTGADAGQEQIWIHVHAVWSSTYTMHESGARARADVNDSISATFDGNVRGSYPAGKRPWNMSAEAHDVQLTVRGGGAGKATGTDTDGKTYTLNTSWTYSPKNVPKSANLARLEPGSFDIQIPGFPDLDSKAHSNEPANLAEGMAFTGMALQLVPGALPCLIRLIGPAVLDGSFVSQLHGTFDKDSKSFSRSGHASHSGSPSLDAGSTCTSSVEISYSINFNQQPEDVEAVIIPPDTYDQWLPTAGVDEDTPGNAMAFSVVLQKKGQPGKAPDKKAKSFKFELIDVSNEPGVCLNWPPQAQAKTTADLKIDPKANSGLQVAGDGQSATSGSDLRATTVTVSSYDWGAYGKIRITATLDDDAHTQVIAHLKGKSEVTEVSLPKDDNGNHIADGWENEIGADTSASTDDLDAEPQSDNPGDGHSGDGLSAYEEYRGFRVRNEGGHVRTDPSRKDVFIYDRNDLGLGWFWRSLLAIHLLKRDEFAYSDGESVNPRVINFNAGTAHLGNEHVIEVRNGTGDGPLGITEGGPNVPKNIAYVLVDQAACLASRWKQEELANTLAHELGHATNVRHHGDGDFWPETVGRYLSPNRCGDRGPMDRSGGEIAVPSGEASGDLNCIMRVYRTPWYESPTGSYCTSPDGAGRPLLLRLDKTGPTPHPGSLYCTSNEGTGVAGNAARGNCSHQFCVNDILH